MTSPTSKICPECLASHERRKSRFCSTAHQRAFDNRKAGRGKAIVALAQAWAMGRGGGHTPANPTSRTAMRELTQILREFNEDDRASGRMSAIDYVDLLQAHGSRHFDRRRK